MPLNITYISPLFLALYKGGFKVSASMHHKMNRFEKCLVVDNKQK